MAWRAIEELGPSYRATKGLLLPFDVRRWLTLAIVAFFVSGVSGVNPGPSTSSGTAQPDEGAADLPGVTGEAPTVSEVDILLIVLAVGVVLAVGLLAVLVGAIMEFVFVRVVTDRDVRIRGVFSDNARKGLSLFLFRVAVLLGVVALVGIPIVLAVLSPPFVLLLLAILLVPVLVVLALSLWVLHRFTADFVVPVMLLEDVGVLAAWRSFWPTLRADWKQYAVYAISRVVLGFVAGIAVAIGFAVVAVALLVPFGILGVLAWALFAALLSLGAVAIAAVVGLAALYLAAVLVVGTTAVQVPIQTYLRYYSLFVLGSVTPTFDMVESLRSEGTGGDDETPAEGAGA